MIRRGWILVGLLALAPAVSQAALVMLVDGVRGPSTVINHVGWFDIRSVNWGLERGSPTAPQSFNVVLESSAAVATLMQAGASGTSLKTIVVDTLVLHDGGQKLVSRLTCEDSQIRQFNAAGQADDKEVISLKLVCGRIAWEKYDYTSKSEPLRSFKGSWNFRTNTP